MSRICNKCGFVGDEEYFIKSERYKGGHRPLCKMCKFKNQRIKRGMEVIDWKPRWGKTLHKEYDRIQILIDAGFARNEEEAIAYIGNGI